MPVFFPPIPAGVVVDYGGASAPDGWLLCDGSAVSRTTFADLFTAIGTAYGAGDGATTFNVPDARGRGTVGLGTHADVNALGNNDALALASRTPNHTHGPGNLGGTTGNNDAAGPATSLTGSKAQNPHQHPFTVTTGQTSSGRQPYIVFNKIVKT